MFPVSRPVVFRRKSGAQKLGGAAFANKTRQNCESTGSNGVAFCLPKAGEETEVWKSSKNPQLSLSNIMPGSCAMDVLQLMLLPNKITFGSANFHEEISNF